MNTTQLVDEIVRRFKNFERDGEDGVLQYLNAANAILYQVEAEQTIVFDQVTGMLPVLATIAGQNVYTLPDEYWRCGNILVSAARARHEFGYASQFAFGSPHGCRSEDLIVYGGHRYWPVEKVKTRDSARSGSPVQILFQGDPGTTTNVYHIRGYKRPTNILSETVDVDIPEPLDIECLVPATCSLIDGVLNGTYPEALQYVKRTYGPVVQKRLNGGAQGSIDAEPMGRYY